jgi:hypothetical protein
VRAVGARVLFGSETDLAYWSRELRAGRALSRAYAFAGPAEIPPAELGWTAGALPLLLERKGQVAPVDDQTRIRPGDRLTVLEHKDASSPPSPLLTPVLAAPAESVAAG